MAEDVPASLGLGIINIAPFCGKTNLLPGHMFRV